MTTTMESTTTPTMAPPPEPDPAELKTRKLIEEVREMLASQLMGAVHESGDSCGHDIDVGDHLQEIDTAVNYAVERATEDAGSNIASSVESLAGDLLDHLRDEIEDGLRNELSEASESVVKLIIEKMGADKAVEEPGQGEKHLTIVDFTDVPEGELPDAWWWKNERFFATLLESWRHFMGCLDAAGLLPKEAPLTDVSASEWQALFLAWSASKKVMHNKPLQFICINEAADMVWRMLDRDQRASFKEMLLGRNVNPK